MNQIKSLLLFSLSLICFFQAVAQNSYQLQLAGDLTSDQASSILQTAKEVAQSEQVLVNIAIVDAGANLKAFLRMYLSYLVIIDLAIN